MIASIHAALRNNHRKNSEGDARTFTLHTLPMPDRKHSFQVEMIGINKKWDSRVFVVTANDICIGKADTEVQIDRIPLVDIVNIQGCHHKGGWYQRCMRSCGVVSEKTPGVFTTETRNTINESFF